MPAPATQVLQSHIHEAAKLELRAADPAAETDKGFCGRLMGIALPYGVVDTYRTVFQAGCLDRTRGKKVAARKVKLFLDHSYGVRQHVGTVLEMPDVGGAAMVVGGLFDTPAGREAKEYLQAVLASGSETGLSVGFYCRDEKTGEVDGQKVTVFTEIELDEISITPRQSVPGATVTGTRKEAAPLAPDEVAGAERTFRILAEALPAERVAAIVAEVETAKRGQTPTPTAPADPSGAKPVQPAPASGEDPKPAPRQATDEDVPLDERLRMLTSVLQIPAK